MNTVVCGYPNCYNVVDLTGGHICGDCGERFCPEHMEGTICTLCRRYLEGTQSVRQYKYLHCVWTGSNQLMKILNKWGKC